MIIEHPVEWHPEHRQSKKKMVIKEQLKYSLRQWWMDKVSAILAWVLIKEDVHNLWSPHDHALHKLHSSANHELLISILPKNCQFGRRFFFLCLLRFVIILVFYLKTAEVMFSRS